jgi:hypothetical protein
MTAVVRNIIVSIMIEEPAAGFDQVDTKRGEEE